MERLEIYEALLRHWQKGMNLVAPGTLDHLWHRHFADSAQLLALAPDSGQWLDLGSGAGFPGLVIAVCSANREDSLVHIIESNARKCAFCKEVVRETGCSVEIHHARIESLGHSGKFDGVEIVTARALAPLGQLFKLVHPFLRPGMQGLFPKGRQALSELAEAEKDWTFEAVLHPSITDADAKIVQVTQLQEKGSEDVEAANE
ncbi:MAG: 16S rRNA (guanine(527)-N(7))-methyltransferase RsmG [Alphaproteobacteria bacterium]